MINIKIISRNPIVLKDTDSLYQDLYEHLNESLKNRVSENFKFTSTTGEEIKERYRNIYPTNIIINENIEIKKILKIFAKENYSLAPHKDSNDTIFSLFFN